MKKCLFVVSVVLTILQAVTTLGCLAEEIRIGFFKWPPLIDHEKGQEKPMGSVVDYYENELAEKMGVTFKWLGPFPVPRVIKMLQRNQIDMIPCLTKNPEREKTLLYPDKSFYIMKPVICLRSGLRIDKFRKWEDLSLVADRVGVFYGSAFQKKMEKKHPELKIRNIWDEHNTIKYALTLIEENKLDAFIHSDKMMTDRAISELKFENKLQSIGAPEPQRPIYVIFSPKREELLNRYNILFDKIKYTIDD